MYAFQIRTQQSNCGVICIDRLLYLTYLQLIYSYVWYCTLISLTHCRGWDDFTEEVVSVKDEWQAKPEVMEDSGFHQYL